MVRRRFNDSPDGAAKTLGKTLGPTVTTTASTVTNEQKKLARISFDGLLNTHLAEVTSPRLVDVTDRPPVIGIIIPRILR